MPGEKFWPRLCAALERADLLADERFATNRSRIEHREALIAELQPVFRGASSDHWVELLQQADVPCARSYRPQMLSQVMRAHPQVRANEMLVDRSSQWGPYQSSAPHWQFEKTPVVIPRAAPALGEHNEALLGAQGVFARDSLEEPQPREAQGAAADEAPALDGLRVIELAEGVPGPLCGFLLAQLGAEVVKVEPPGGDWMRDVPPGDEGESALFAALNSGKQGRVIDLQTAAGRDELRSLTAEADVAVVGYRPHKLERLGIAYEQLRAENGRADLLPDQRRWHRGTVGRPRDHGARRSGGDRDQLHGRPARRAAEPARLRRGVHGHGGGRHSGHARPPCSGAITPARGRR